LLPGLFQVKGFTCFKLACKVLVMEMTTFIRFLASFAFFLESPDQFSLEFLFVTNSLRLLALSISLIIAVAIRNRLFRAHSARTRQKSGLCSISTVQ
jgi:hypothetical protein